jgi:hypothetical protein
VATFERLTLASRLVGLHTLLTEADRLNLIARLRHNDVRLGRVRGRALRLIVTGDASFG